MISSSPNVIIITIQPFEIVEEIADFEFIKVMPRANIQTHEIDKTNANVKWTKMWIVLALLYIRIKLLVQTLLTPCKITIIYE